MKKRTKKILLIFLSIIIVCFLGLSIFVGIQIVNATTQLTTNETTGDMVTEYEWERYQFDEKAFSKAYEIEELMVKSSFDKHQIPVSYIYANPSQKNKNSDTVIMVHGLGGNRKTPFPIAHIFLENGYNVLTFDQRSSGENTAEYTTFGYYEKFDLIDCLGYIKNNSENKKIGLWGESFGGATVGLALGYQDTDDKTDFVILDSPISSMEWMIREYMESMDIGDVGLSYLIKCGNLVNKIRRGFFYGAADVPTAMKDVNTPVLIINSKADDVTPYFMGKDIYDSIKGKNKELWTVEDSAHIEERMDYKKEYREKIDELIGSIK